MNQCQLYLVPLTHKRVNAELRDGNRLGIAEGTAGIRDNSPKHRDTFVDSGLLSWSQGQSGVRSVRSVVLDSTSSKGFVESIAEEIFSGDGAVGSSEKVSNSLGDVSVLRRLVIFVESDHVEKGSDKSTSRGVFIGERSVSIFGLRYGFTRSNDLRDRRGVTTDFVFYRPKSSFGNGRSGFDLGNFWSVIKGHLLTTNLGRSWKRILGKLGEIVRDSRNRRTARNFFLNIYLLKSKCKFAK